MPQGGGGTLGGKEECFPLFVVSGVRRHYERRMKVGGKEDDDTVTAGGVVCS